MPIAVVLLSGGLDSTVALWWAKKQGYQCRALAFNYGQRHKKEILISKKIASVANVTWQLVDFRLPWGGSALTDKSIPIPHKSLAAILKSPIPSTYVPGRNTLFLSFALSKADAENATAIVIGANAIDYSGYPDCRPNFLHAFEKVAQLGSRSGSEKKIHLKVLSPLVKLTKAEIIRLGVKLKAPLHLTWSCYSGGARPCGRCDSCVLRAKGFEEAGFKDSALSDLK